MSILLFGLTGGVASGKSAIACHWRGQGLPVLDADRIARDVVAVGSEGLRRVVERFGPLVLDGNGALDRPALGAIVFARPDARKDLEAIVHPLIRARTAELGRRLEERGVSLACYEAALLVENGLADRFRPLVVVAAPAAVQLERMGHRDGLSMADAQRRLAAQLPLAEKIALADYVIDNGGRLDQSLAAADGVLRQIRAAVGQGRWGAVPSSTGPPGAPAG